MDINKKNTEKNTEKNTKKNKLKRLQDSYYKRPKMTYTEKINNDESLIIDKLEDYVKVDNIHKVKTGTHLRYYKMENGKKKFVLGGKLIKKVLPEYIILTNGRFTWSVQLDTVITFFRKMSIDEIKKEYDDLIIELEEKNENYVAIIKKQRNEIVKLKNQIKNSQI